MFYVYLLASKPYGTLYVGTTSDLARRVWEHKNGFVPGFTKRYQVDRLVWFEVHVSSASALRREKQLKEWKRDWKSIYSNETTRTGWTSTQASDSKCVLNNDNTEPPEFRIIRDDAPDRRCLDGQIGWGATMGTGLRQWTIGQ